MPYVVGIASTQPWSIDGSSGRKQYQYVHWGTVIDNVFYPNAKYLSASAEEKRRLIFSSGWDMDNAGFSNIVYMTDRGYESMRNIEALILKGSKAVLCVKTSIGMVLERIQVFGDFTVRPDGMEIDLETKCYMVQYPLEYKVRGNGQCVKDADHMRLNLYFDPVRRSREIVALDAEIKSDTQELERLVASREKLDSIKTLKKEYPLFELEFEEKELVLKSLQG